MVVTLKSARNRDKECRHMKGGVVDSADENLPLVNGWHSKGAALLAPEDENLDVEVPGEKS